MLPSLRYPASAIVASGHIGPDDLVLLRTYLFPDGVVTAEDALELVRLNRSEATKCAEWRTWFVEQMAAFIIENSSPQGSLDSQKAKWLADTIAAEGVISEEAEFEFLLHAIELSRTVPEQLSVLALEQVRLGIAEGQGIYAALRLRAGRRGISNLDMSYINRILKASYSVGRTRLGASETAILEKIDNAVRDENNAPVWRLVFGEFAHEADAPDTAPVVAAYVRKEDRLFETAA